MISDSIQTFRRGTFIAIFLSLLGVIALQASPAHAQAQPPICQEYPDLDICDEPTGGGGDNPDGDDDVGPGAGSGGAGSGDGDGSLPFTGYPLTTLILLFLILLAAGLALRAAITFRDRLDRGSLQR